MLHWTNDSMLVNSMLANIKLDPETEIQAGI
jgi:hypothetical protein